jgi:phage I-like protein
MNADDLPDCEECLRLMVLALAKSAADPQNLALLPSEEAETATEYLRQLLGKPDGSLEELARLLASKAKARVGIFEN